MDLRGDVDDGSVRVDRARKQADEPDDPESVVAAIKDRRFDGAFVDADAEAIVDDALLALVRGDEDDAADRLADAFTTPCELDEPELVELDDGRQVACHLYD
jgi:peptide/nickel transport system ATP-binding protein